MCLCFLRQLPVTVSQSQEIKVVQNYFVRAESDVSSEENPTEFDINGITSDHTYSLITFDFASRLNHRRFVKLAKHLRLIYEADGEENGVFTSEYHSNHA